MLEIALKELKNRGPIRDGSPRVKEYFAAVEMTPEQITEDTAWCCAFVQWCVEQACKQQGRDNPLLKTAYCPKLYEWADQQKFISTTPKPGDIFLRIDPEYSSYEAAGHTGLVRSTSENSFSSIEGNTCDGTTSWDTICSKTYLLPNRHIFIDMQKVIPENITPLSLLHQLYKLLSSNKEALAVLNDFTNHADVRKFLLPYREIPSSPKGKGFAEALAFVLKWEGGYSNDPADKGGSTNYGITQRTYNAWLRERNLPIKDVKDITTNEISEIYRNYWTSSPADTVPWPLSLVIFDTAVNFGVSGAIMFIQEALGVEADGGFGPITSSALSKADPFQIAIKIVNGRIAYRHQRVAEVPSQDTFLLGWLNRDNDLMSIVKGVT